MELQCRKRYSAWINHHFNTAHAMTKFKVPFTDELFYYAIPDWLQHVRSFRQLHALELLFYHIYDSPDQSKGEPNHGRILTYKESKPDYWKRVEAEHILPALFTESGLLNSLIRVLVEARKLSPLLSRDIPATYYRETVHEAFDILGWPKIDHILYRPKGFIQYRWLGWLKERNGTANLALLGLCALLGEVLPQQFPTQIDPTIPIKFTLDAVETHAQEIGMHFNAADPNPFPEIAWLNNVRQRRKNIRAGLDDLAILGAIELAASPLDTYTVRLDTFNAPPAFPDQPLRDYCAFRCHEPHQPERLKLVRTVLRYWHGSLNKIREVKNQICHEIDAQHLSNSRHELLSLNAYLIQKAHKSARSRTIDKPRRVGFRQEITEYKDQRSHARYRYGSSFVLQATAYDLATIEDAEPHARHSLHMGVNTAHDIDATHLLILLDPGEGMTQDKIKRVLPEIQLVVSQLDQAGELHSFHFKPFRNRKIDGNILYTEDMSKLHRELDFQRPFTMLLSCHQPDPRLILYCEFRHQS